MASKYFFYDLETSGLVPREDRIMQFAGICTDLDLQPIGDPVNLMIKMSPDILPQPEAVLLTGITPQMTLSEGLSEAEFLDYFYKEIVAEDTTFLGYNSVRFDDEFMRFLHYRNFYDPYEWQWAQGCSRWDILDLVRMTRALRPEGITWPTKPDGTPTNTLESLTTANRLNHSHAHDALSDVEATIAVTRLIKDKQPALFDYLLSCRKKNEVSKLVMAGKPFTYTSSHFSSNVLNTTVVQSIGETKRKDGAFVYDLRIDPTPFMSLSVEELFEKWQLGRDRQSEKLPVKTLRYNRCPAIAPGVVSDEASLNRLHLSRQDIIAHAQILKGDTTGFRERVAAAAERMNHIQEEKTQSVELSLQTVDTFLYDGFIAAGDKALLAPFRNAIKETRADLISQFQDKRLSLLAILYIARNYPSDLDDEMRKTWDEYRTEKLLGNQKHGPLVGYFEVLDEAGKRPDLTENQAFLLEELRLYGEAIVPDDATG